MFRFRFFFVLVFCKNLSSLILSCFLSRFYSFGFVLSMFFVLQIVSGCCLSFCFLFTCYFIDLWWYLLLFCLDFELIFMIRSLHIFVTSFVWFLLFMHIGKCFMCLLMFDTHCLVWLVGFLIFVIIILITFIGYVLPCTMMSYWGLVVFSNIVASIPLIGCLIMLWLWGCEFINDYTFMKMHSLHVFLPFIFLFLMVWHFVCLHYFISSDFFMDRFCFYCERLFLFLLLLIRDFFVIFCFIFCCCILLLIKWYIVFHEESFVVVIVTKTADKILPEWFFLFFFGYVKSFPDKFIGLVLCVLLFIILWLFVINICLFLLCIRFYAVWYFIVLLFFLLMYIISFLALFVILCYPIWLELQFCVLCSFLIFLWRMD